MNLTKLFETQAELDKKIIEGKGLHGVDLLGEKILALQVELGELANEWQLFKFWKDDPKSRTKVFRWFDSFGEKIEVEHDPNMLVENFEQKVSEVNPLLEEYVDCLHFILGIGNELEQKPPICDLNLQSTSITKQFNGLFYAVSKIRSDYYDVVMQFVGLGKMLGFTSKQIEQAYYEKNEINHERQENGY